MIKKVVKRDGTLQDFNLQKIVKAILLANARVGNKMTDAEIENVAIQTKNAFNLSTVLIENIEKEVEKQLMKKNYDVAREYIGYRRKRADERQKVESVFNNYSEIIDLNNEEILKENGNVNGASMSGKKSKVSSENDKWYALNFLLPEEVAKAHKNGLVHQHDLDWWAYGTTNCVQIDLPDILSRPFSTGDGSVRVANSIGTAFQLVAIIMQSVQNCQFGGVGAAAVDTALAPFVKKSFNKFYRKGFEYLQKIDLPKNLEWVDIDSSLAKSYSEVYEYALAETIEATYQGAESLIHNLNTMNSRSGSQTPFSSINYGIDTSIEGRMVSKAILESTMKGLGNGENPIFPIQVFTCLNGVNQNEGEPNYDLFKLAIECSSKRLFPNFCNVSAPYNLKYYDPSDYRTAVATIE